jgi:tRNA-dihydrouridine synthase B
LRNHVLLAPMAGVTDVPFRSLAWQFGAGYVVGEMLSARAELWDTTKSRLRRHAVDGVWPVAVQIAGSEPAMMAEAARRHWRDGAHVIDINFGCPAKKVCRKAAGSALLADEALVAAIIRATVAAVPVPVTVKIRSGYSPDMRNGVRIAEIAEGEGARAVTVHGRTRACRFEGAAEYETAAAIKSRVGIPVFANGDIGGPADADRVLAATGADGVMIGRAALGAPWLPGQIAGVIPEPSLDEKLAVMRAHVQSIHAFYGEDRGVRVARKHVSWYLEKLTEVSEGQRSDLRRRFNGTASAGVQLECLERLVPPRAA